MALVKNISDGPRGIRTADGVLVMIEKGKSANLDLADGEAESETGWFEFGGAEAADELPSLARMNKTELLAQAEAEGVDVADGATNAEIVEAIEQARAA